MAEVPINVSETEFAKLFERRQGFVRSRLRKDRKGQRGRGGRKQQAKNKSPAAAPPGSTPDDGHGTNPREEWWTAGAKNDDLG